MLHIEFHFRYNFTRYFGIHLNGRIDIRRNRVRFIMAHNQENYYYIQLCKTINKEIMSTVGIVTL